jgi:hypothetical protein
MKKILIIISIVSVIGGLLIGSPLAEAGETKGVGYWKNNDGAREAYIAAAAATSNVFAAPTSLRLYLSLKGKKTMMQKAMRQLGALMLNMEASLQSSNLADLADTLLSQGEVAMINSINGNTGFELGTAAVGDAVAEIEHAITCSPDWQNPLPDECNNVASTIDDLEDAIDLADDINNRGVYF